MKLHELTLNKGDCIRRNIWIDGFLIELDADDRFTASNSPWVFTLQDLKADDWKVYRKALGPMTIVRGQSDTYIYYDGKFYAPTSIVPRNKDGYFEIVVDR